MEREHRLADGRSVVIRPIGPRDEAAERAFFRGLSPRARYLRFLGASRMPSDEMVHLFASADQVQRVAYVCEDAGDPGRLLGDARYQLNPGGRSAEFSIVIADSWHGSGIAELLMRALLGAAREHGLEALEGCVLRENEHMLHFMRRLGFDVTDEPAEPRLLRLSKRIAPEPASAG